MAVPAVSSYGLTAAEARRRLDAFGPNRLVPAEDRTRPLAVARQIVTDPMAILLAIAAVTYYVLGDIEDAVIAVAALVPVVGVSVVLEIRAERALEALRRLAAPTALVIRDGVEESVPAADVVPGDAVVLREGDIVPADARIVAGTDLVVDESALTGESLTITKTTDPNDAGAVWAGTTVLAGRATAVVGVTGLATRYGKIAALVAEVRESPTPLQSIVRRLFAILSVVAGVFCAGVFALELSRGASAAEALIAGVSLAMAAIPEEFPMVFTLYLGLGAWRLARDHALVRRLVGVETLGATSVICADKTGTLTLGTIEVGAVWTAPGLDEREVLRAAVLASEPRPYDPLEQALVRAAAARGIDVGSLHANTLLRDHAFDRASASLTHVWRVDGELVAYAKGAIEAFASRGATPPEVYAAAHAANDRLAARGMRIIAVARAGAVAPEGDRATDESGLVLAGLVAFTDPIRSGVADAIAECRSAGIRVVMITGDHPATAMAVAADLDLRPVTLATGPEVDAADDGRLAELVGSANVFARVRPDHKYRLVRALKARGDVVAMTGDGTNDAPALREADIGIAMGRRGTEVARSASTLVLLDDDFTTIVAAVRDGRRIFDNLRRAFGYLIAFHVPLLATAIVVPLAGAPLLLLPVHLVLLELLLHPTVALVFEADPADRRLMRRQPRRRDASLLERGHAVTLVIRGLVLTVPVLALYLGALAIGWDAPRARGIALVTLIAGQFLLVLVERSGDLHVWERLGENRVLGWIAAATAALLAVIELLGPVASRLHLAPPPPEGWALALVLAAAATLWGELGKRHTRTDDLARAPLDPSAVR